MLDGNFPILPGSKTGDWAQRRLAHTTLLSWKAPFCLLLMTCHPSQKDTPNGLCRDWDFPSQPIIPSSVRTFVRVSFSSNVPVLSKHWLENMITPSKQSLPLALYTLYPSLIASTFLRSLLFKKKLGFGSFYAAIRGTWRLFVQTPALDSCI